MSRHGERVSEQGVWTGESEQRSEVEQRVGASLQCGGWEVRRGPRRD